MSNPREKFANRKSKNASRTKAKYLSNRRFNRNKKKSGPFLQICKGKCMPELSNSNTEQMEVDPATTINIQEELIREILSRLPVRSLMQCKCVSKFWNTLICDPYFKRKHLKRAKNDQNCQKLILYHWSREDIFSCYCCPLSPNQLIDYAQKFVRPLGSKRFFRIQCCFDGLVLVKASDTIDDKCPILLLWNPSTKESIELLSVELQDGPLNIFGLGYDSTSDSYKMLKISATLIRDHWECSGEILALKGGSWRKIDGHPHGICYRLSHTHTLAFVHEAFHWIGMSSNFSLVSFSISNEAYGEIPLPGEILSLVGNINLGVSVLDEKLCVCSSTFRQVNRTFKLWVMNDYGVKDSWNPLVTIEDSSIYNVIPKYRFADGEVLFWCGHPSTGGHAFRTPSGPFVYWQQGGLQNGVAFTESLISPKSVTC